MSDINIQNTPTIRRSRSKCNHSCEQIFIIATAIIGLVGFVFNIISFKNISYNVPGCNITYSENIRRERSLNKTIYLNKDTCCPSDFSMMWLTAAFTISVPCLWFIFSTIKMRLNNNKTCISSCLSLFISIVALTISCIAFFYCFKMFALLTNFVKSGILMSMAYTILLLIVSIFFIDINSIFQLRNRTEENI